MKNLFNELNQELINRGIVYESTSYDSYDTSVELEGVYDWGFTTVTYCNVLDPIITFYDWEYQSILSLDMDSNTNYKLNNGTLVAEETCLFSNECKRYVVDLKQGAPVHIDDVAVIGYVPNDNYNDKRFYALKNGRIYYKEDGSHLYTLPNESVDVLLKQGFVLIEPKCYASNINILNDLISKVH